MVNLLDRFRSAARFSYDALKPDKKRRSISAKVPREDFFAKGSKRRSLQANAADLSRNLSLAAWMVRRHLDYVSEFAFYSRNQTGSDDVQGKDLDEQIQRLMREDSIPNRSDIAGKFGREKLFRMAEARRVLDGDTYLIKLANMRLQGLGGDLVRDPQDTQPGETWINGHLINGVGRTKQIGVYQRDGYNSEGFDRRLSATNVIHYGFFDRYAGDQVRGISPIISALNPLRDIYENFDFALAKMKISQLFAMAIYQEGPDSALELGGGAPPAEAEDQDGDHIADTDRGFEAFIKSDLRFLDLNPGEKAEIIESKQPSGEFQSFTQIVIAVALKALDLPFSFYDESFTNFFGSRGAWLHYERSCHDKRADQIEMRRQYTIWKLRGWIIDGRLELPAGLTIADLLWEWVPRGMPWWDPSKEIKGAVQAIDAGLDNPQRICMSTGTDFFDNVDKIAAAQDYAASRGVSVSWEDTTPDPIEVEQDDRDQAIA